MAVVPEIKKPEEVLKKKGGKIREVLGLDYTEVSKEVKKTWTPERREAIKTTARQVGQYLAQAWERSDQLSNIAGKLAETMEGKVSMPLASKRLLKMARFKYHDGTRVWIVGFPTVGTLDFRHALKTGTVSYSVGGYFAEYERTAKGLKLIQVHWRGFDLKELLQKIKEVKQEVLQYARNKYGVRLSKAFELAGVSVGV